MAPFLLPLAVGVQEATARLGLVTGKGLGTLIRERFPRWVLVSAVVLLATANTLNIAADLASMAAALRLLAPVPAVVGVIGFAVAIGVAEVMVPYHRYSRVLRWFALSLVAYVLVLVVVRVPWSTVAARTFLPQFHLDAATTIALTAIAGTTVSPYLFFWQASEEVEELQDTPDTPLDRRHLVAMRVDVWTGMLSGVITIFAIMCTAAVTLGPKERSTSSRPSKPHKPWSRLPAASPKCSSPSGSSASACSPCRYSRGPPPTLWPRRSTGAKASAGVSRTHPASMP